MENFYGGRRGPKGDSLNEITLDKCGKLKYKTKSYIVADEDGAKISDYINAGEIKFVEDIDFGNDGIITYIYNYYDTETSDKKHFRTDKLWTFPATRVTYGGNTNIDSYIKSLDYTATGLGTDKTITAISETDGKIAVTASNISIASSQIKDKTDTFNSVGTEVITGKAVNAALQTLDATGTTDFGKGKTIKTWSETDGKVSITSQDISIVATQISDKATTLATKEQGDKADTAVQSIKITGSEAEYKVGTTVTLPAYPSTPSEVGAMPADTKIPSTAADVNALPDDTVIPTISNTYSETSEDGMSGKAVAEALVGYKKVNLVSEELWPTHAKIEGELYYVYDTEGNVSVKLGMPTVSEP